MKEEEKIMGEEYSQLIPAATLSARNLGKVKKEVIQEVYEYWKKKRLAAGKPFIPRLQMEEVEIRHSASYVRHSPRSRHQCRVYSQPCSFQTSLSPSCRSKNESTQK